NIYRLGLKELFSLRYDAVLVFLIIYGFTYEVYISARHAAIGVHNAAVAIVDEDRSPLSWRIRDSLLSPYFLTPVHLAVLTIDAAMDAGRYTFVMDIPPNFQADVARGRRPAIQLNVDATAMTQAATGASYIQRIIAQELTAFLEGPEAGSEPP